ncbi:MAG: T9SS type A sorting domain-containing protein [Candidatus Kapabacteria bacterium]|nr:T9SS type A sorting domain-containing protein [Candidatus Kapabacteria bacterium]
MKRAFIFFNFLILTVLTLSLSYNTAVAAPPAPDSLYVPQVHCSGSSVTYTVASVSSATFYAWEISGEGWSPSSATTTNPTNYLAITSGTGDGMISVRAGDEEGVSDAVSSTVTPIFVPDDPTSINKPGTHCINSSRTYTVDPIPHAEYYEWIVSGEGWSGSSTMTSIEVTNTSSTVTCSISVAAHSSCGSSTTFTTTVVPDDLVPASPSEPMITNTHAIEHCENLERTYSIDAQTGTDEYLWLVTGSGWSITSTNNTTEVDIISGTSDGTITVFALNDCGVSSATSKTVTPVDIPDPLLPGTISVPVQHCNGTPGLYSVAPVTGAEWYNWEVSGAGWSVSTSIDTLTAIIAGTGTGTITVIAENACGTSAPSTMTYTPQLFDATPGPITEPDYHCILSSQTYTIDEVPDADGYLWTVTGSGWMITSSSNTTTCVLQSGIVPAEITVATVNDCGAGIPRVIEVTPLAAPDIPAKIIAPAIHCAGTSATYTVPETDRAESYDWFVTGSAWTIQPSSTDEVVITSGPGSATITCYAINTCGTSTTVSLVKEPLHIPAAPGKITAPDYHCIGSEEVYAIVPIPAATSYEWTVIGSGWTGSSTISEITIEAGSGTGIITVRGVNYCGYGDERTIEVIADVLPEEIAEIEIPTNHCVGVSKPYSVMPVKGSAAYTWEIVSDVSDGKDPWTGNSSSNYIYITPGPGSATITCYATNRCGSGEAATIVHKALQVPAQPETIVKPAMHCPTDIKEYSVPVVAGVDTYIWEITGNGWSGASASATISITAGNGHGTISVTPKNVCGMGKTRMINVNASPVIEAPEAITGPDYHCMGYSKVYSVTPVENAVSYEWTIEGEEWEGTSESTTITITSGDDTGKITCAAVNSCGAGDPISIEVAPELIPSSQFRVSSDTVEVTDQLTVSYQGSSDEAAIFTWDFDGGTAEPGTGIGPHNVSWTTLGRKTITLEVEDKTCASPQTMISVIVDKPGAVDEYQELFYITIAPNPNNGNFRLDLAEFPYPEVEVSIYDMLGKVYHNVKLMNNGNGISKTFNLNQLTSGVYLIKLRFNNEEIVRQLNLVK